MHDRRFYFISIFAGLIGGFFGPLCCCGHILSGAIAVGIYVQSEPEIFMSDKDACIGGAIAGFWAGIFSILFGLLTLGEIYDLFWAVLGLANKIRLQQQLEQYWAAVGYFAFVNLLLSIVFNSLGGWTALRWLYQKNRIPPEVQSWTP